MLRRTITALSLALLAAASLAGSKPEAPPVPAVLQPSEQELKRVTEDVQKATADKNDELLARAMGDMVSLRHESFVPFIRAGAKSASPEVVAASLRAAATHELKDMEKDVRKILHAAAPKKSDKDNTGLAGEKGSAAIDYLVRLEIGGEESTVLDDWLVPMLTPTFGDDRRLTASWSQDLLRASIHYVGKFKSKRAVPTLIDLIAVPEKKPMHDGKNPNPSDAWFTAREKLWRASEGWARWALKEITGQEFRLQREWEAWLRLNKKDYK
jgi:hypothetical protein